ncbi:hypothetical protein [Chryseobacterium limigenitum]|uniref:Uncharacterized protein n=1 Tax=Chryseobacterium limigenitum TaxID=1612149 RepID=A0A1K2IXA8_9FLAO|nr:hypothetical protein [Chryseobacterium limigenitum]SFZ96926.1 hypothetical protein SAMN05216324_13020 [Chryseobacterium limigenitum]
MTTEQKKIQIDALRNEVLLNYSKDGYIIAHESTFTTNFEYNITDFYKQSKKGYSKGLETISSIQSTYNSDSFKNVFSDLKKEFLSFGVIKSLYPNDKTFKSFLENKTPIKGASLDFFSVCIGRKGWNDFTINGLTANNTKDDLDLSSHNKPIENQQPKIVIEEKINDTNKIRLDLDFIANHSISRSEELIDAFNAGLHNFFINCFENYDKDISDKKFSSKNTFPVLFKSLHFDGLFSFETFDYILKRLKIDKHELDNESSPFDDEETKTIFVIGNLIADRIFNRIAIDLYGDSKHLYNRRVVIDNTILSILALLDVEYIYLNTLENYSSVEPLKILNFISEFKGAIRKKYPYKDTNAEIGNFISKVYLLGFESTLEEIISYREGNKFEEVDFFTSQIQEVHTWNNIEYFVKLENTEDLEKIKQKIDHSFLRDFFVLGELIAQDFVGYLAFSTETIYETEEEFEKDMSSYRELNEIENLTTSLNLQHIYNSYMPKLYYEDKRCKLEGNYNVFLMKILKQIKNLN